MWIFEPFQFAFMNSALLIALVALVGCRRLLNGEGFVVFALYCRTARLTRVARTLRLKSR